MIVARNIPDTKKDDETLATNRSVEETPEEWAPWNLVVSIRNPNAPAPVTVKTQPGPVWDIAEVLKAAHLLCKSSADVVYKDEQEMRCVYSLIYDVFRYKSILEQVIDDVNFFDNYPEYSPHRHVIWLFLMELAKRRWAARPRGEVERAEKLLNEAGHPFKEIENAVWEQRVHFAAAVAKIRIKHKAFTLSELLPPHLRDERVSACVNKDTVTGWVNTFKAKKVATLIKRLHELGYSYSSSRQLCAGEYRFDRVCPRFIMLRPPADVGLGQVDLVKDGIIVLQEREFCEGASTLCRALRANALHGVVAQTHASSPRCSAYLAAQLRELAAVVKARAPAAPATPQLGKLVVFGAGDKVDSYVCALRELGIEASEAPHSGAPVCVISDPVHCDTALVSNALDGVVAALATPPNSYSAVTDPIDLVCGRGGDLAMLEILTESEMDSNATLRVQTILEEQKKTLRTLMSKPQIQLILYETHSALEAENQAQVSRAVDEANRLARERHILLQKKHKNNQNIKREITDSTYNDDSTAPDVDKSVHELNKNDDVSVINKNTENANVLKKNMNRNDSIRLLGPNKSRPIPDVNFSNSDPGEPPSEEDCQVPDCDLFEIQTLPNLGNGLDIKYILDRDGCFLGLIQRKEITRLDAKYMIQVAEERGLFGSHSAPPAARRKRPDQTLSSPKRRRRKTAGFEVERVSAPTFASMTRARREATAAFAEAGAEAGAGADGQHWRPACARHVQRLAAAAACTCSARHKNQYRPRRASAGVAVPTRPTSPQCRTPYPLTVHELRLKTVFHRHKMIVS